MEIAHTNARSELIAHQLRRFVDEQTRQFIYSLQEQGLTDEEITRSFQAIYREMAAE